MQYVIQVILASGTENQKGGCGYLEGIQQGRSIMKGART